jgi:hypothetical protein
MCVFTTQAQYVNGVKIDGTVQSVVAQLKTKGFTLDSYSPEGFATMKGTFAGNNVELYVFVTPISKKVWKVVIYFPTVSNWYSIKNDYLEVVEVIKDKYGSPEKSFDFFSKPYYEGDGYEMTAVTMEKCFYSSYWSLPHINTNISAEISKYKQIKIAYENVENAETFSNELKKTKRSSF